MALALVATLSGCGPRGKPAPQTPHGYLGDQCQHLGQKALDRQGHELVCRRGPGEPYATWQH